MGDQRLSKSPPARTGARNVVRLRRRSGAQPNRRRRADEIIKAAARVFAERGYYGASTQDIADEKEPHGKRKPRRARNGLFRAQGHNLELLPL